MCIFRQCAIAESFSVLHLASNLPQEKCEVAQQLLLPLFYLSLVCVFHAKFKCKMVLRSITITESMEASKQANTGSVLTTVRRSKAKL